MNAVLTRDELASIVDHSVLEPDATGKEIAAGADLVRRRGIAFYCVQPCWITLAAGALRGSLAQVVTVVGFPHGCDGPAVKALAAEAAVADGAAEVDVVLNLGLLRSGALAATCDDVAAVVRAVPHVPVNIILETRALSDEEKVTACRLAAEAGVAFVKTSTGFDPRGGATVADVRLLRRTVGTNLGVKAAGGIRTLDAALALLAAGADRLDISATAAVLDALPR